MMRDADVASQRAAGRETVVIEPSRSGWLDEFRQIYRCRDLLRAMAGREIRLAFDRTHFGLLWALARPLVMLAVLTALRHLSAAETGVVIPYPLHLYAGLVCWFWFTETSMQTAGSLRRDAALIRKVHYPRLLTPLVPVIASLPGLGVALLPLLPMMGWYGVGVGPSLVTLPLVLAQTMVLILGVGLIFAGLSLAHRDWERLLSLLLYVGLFVSPVIFAPEMLPAELRTVLYANPMAGTLTAIRASLFEPLPFPTLPWLWSAGCSLLVLAFGLAVFGRVDRSLADRL